MLARLSLKDERPTSENMVRASILLPLLLLLPTPGSAQFDARIKTGAGVRFSTAQPEALLAIGKIASVDGDSIVVDRGLAESQLRLAVRDLTALEVYRRGKSAEMSGMVFGTLGAAAGGVLYVNWCRRNASLCEYLETSDDEDDDWDDEEDEGEPLSLFATVTLGFGMIGYLMGYTLAPPQWEIVKLPVRIGVAPMQRGIGVYVSLPAPRLVTR